MRQIYPRRATARDARDAALLLHRFNTEFGVSSPGPEVLTTRLAQLLDRDPTFAILAGDPAVGVALVTLRPNVWHDGPVALLDELYVVPSCRGAGVGSALLEYAVGRARDAGAELFEINVDQGDTDARRFYERHGFSDVEPDTGEPALYYSRRLTV